MCMHCAGADIRGDSVVERVAPRGAASELEKREGEEAGKGLWGVECCLT